MSTSGAGAATWAAPAPGAVGEARASARGASRVRAAQIVLLAVTCAALALLPRLSDLGRPVTADEPHWFRRSTHFAAGLLSGNPGRTYQTGHPGVTTMWITSLGIGLPRAAAGDQTELDLLSDEQRAAFLDARRALAVVTSLLLAVLVGLAARLFGLLAGALAGCLLALDPWLVAHNRVLHLDGLLALFVGIAVLAVLIRWHGRGGWPYLVVAGVAAGLAALTKSAALALLPPIVLLLALAHLRRRRERRWGVLADLALLGAVAAATLLAVWPAMWADPLGTARQVVEFGLQTGGEPHESGSFFLGRPIDDPGPAFYPLVLAFRLSPLVVLGLLLLAVVGLTPRLRQAAGALGAAGWLVVAAVLVVVVMSAAAKKQDRYVLPAVPLLAVAAAAGLRQALPLLAARRGARTLLLGGVGLAQLALCARERPYYFSVASPLLGGASVQAQVLPVGWGEGIEEVANYLNARPDGRSAHVIISGGVSYAFQALARARTEPPDTTHPVQYQLLYINGAQRGQRLRKDGGKLVLAVRVHGVDYARLYRLR